MTSPGGALRRLLGIALIGAVAALLAWQLIDLESEPAGLTAEVETALPDSGVSQAVTAVLLNFRGYDTWLEVGVLLLAILGVFTLLRSADLTPALPGPPLGAAFGWLVRLVAPLTLIVAGYLLWLGTHSPGGAFQAGAVLAAGLVLLRLAGYPSVALLNGVALRAGLALGFLAFLLVALVTTLVEGSPLQYPADLASWLIVGIELAVAVATGITLSAAFAAAGAFTAAARGREAEPPAGGD